MLPSGPGGAPSLWRCSHWHSPASTPSAWHALPTTPPSPSPGTWESQPARSVRLGGPGGAQGAGEAVFLSAPAPHHLYLTRS